jgi:hypothetical protein
MADVGCQEGEMLLGTPQRQNQVGTHYSRFAHVRTATQGSVSLFPLLVGQKNMCHDNVLFLVDKVCCTTLVLSRIPN